MKQDTKTKLPVVATIAILGSILLLQAGCQSLPWEKSEPEASAKDTLGPVEGPSDQDVPVQIDTAFNAEFDALEDSTQDVFHRPSRPELPPVIEDESVVIAPVTPYGLLGGPVFPKEDDDLAYIVQRGDTLWSISQKFKVSLHKILGTNGLTRTSVISIGQELQIPGVSESQSPVKTFSLDVFENTVYANGGSYTVKKGDNLTRIAYVYGTSVKDLKSANGLITDRLMVGQELVVPSGGPVRSGYKPSPAASTSASGGDYHVVRRGEYPGSIARRYGLKASELMAINNISDPSRLQIGTRLVVRHGGSLPQSVGSHIESAPVIGSSQVLAPTSSGFDSTGTLQVPGDGSTEEVPLLDEDMPVIPIEDVK